MSMETLERRQLLAADFIVDAGGMDVELQRSGEFIQVLDRTDDSLIRQEDVADIDSREIRIAAGSLLVDSSVDLDINSLIVSANTINIVSGSIESDGLISLTAEEQPSLLGTVVEDVVLRGLRSTRNQTIRIDDSTLDGQEVVIAATGVTSTGWDELGAHQDGIAGELLTQLEANPQLGLSAVSPLSGQAKFHTAVAEVTINNAVIQSLTTVDVIATAAADSSLNAIAVTGLNPSGLPATLSVGYSHSDSTATIDVIGTSQINAGGNVNLDTSATSTAINTSRNEANSRLRSDSAPKVKYAVNGSLAYTYETSKINVAAGASIDAGGAVSVDAVGDVKNEVEATTAIFKDGTAGFSFAVGVDNAVVTADVHGSITSSDSGNTALPFPGKNIFSGREGILVPGVPANNPLRVGETLTYERLSTSGDLGLIDGEDYRIHEINSTRDPVGDLVTQDIRVIRAPSIAIDNHSVAADSTHTLTKLGVLRFDSADISSEAGTGDGRITLTVPVGVDRVTYLGPDSDEDGELFAAVGGLTQGQSYEVVRDGGQIKLRLPGSTAFVDFTAPASGSHGFRIDEAVQNFTPATAVIGESDWIEFPSDHGFQTGDFLLYQTDPTKSVTREVFEFDADGNELGSLGETTLPDAPIDGLNSNHGYYAVVDKNNPTRLRLAGSLAGALAAEVVDVTSALGTNHRFIRQNVGGIFVGATLTASNKAKAGVNLSNGEQPWTSVLEGVASGRIESIATTNLAFFKSLSEGFQENGLASAKSDTNTGVNQSAGPDGKSGTDFAGSLAMSFFHHDVRAEIHDGAVLTSDSTILVDADIVQRTKMGVVAQSTRNALNEPDEKDKEFAAGVGYSSHDNQAHAIVGAATLNARGETRVDSDVIVPFLGADDDGVNGVVETEDLGLLSFESFLDGTHGLAGLINVYSQTLADGSRSPLSLAAGVVVTDTTNDVLAKISNGARVNQDAAMRTADQSVVVDSLLDVFVIEAGQMSSLNLSAPGLAEALVRNKGRKKPSVTEFLKDIANPFGVSGKNAAGGTMLLALGTNSTVAEIEPNVEIVASDLSVTANSDLYNLAIVQTGTQSSQFGFSAAIAAANIQTNTRASIAEGTTIIADSLHVGADDNLDRINIAGAFLLGKQVGVGTSIGVNIIDQNVAARVGRADTMSPGVVPTENSLSISGPIDIKAAADGDLFSLVMAGALQGLGRAEAKANAKPIGPIALTIPVAVNNVTSDVQAYLDSQHAWASSVDVDSSAETDVQAVVAGASFAIRTASASPAGKLNLAGAGAVGVNTVAQNVAAFIKDSDVQSAGDVTVGVMDKTTVESDAGGFGFAASASPQTRAALSFGVSVAINDISGTSAATIENSILVLTGGDLLVDAKGNSSAKALSIAGGVSANFGAGASGSFGGAGAAAINDITKTVKAEAISGSAIAASSGSVTVSALDDSEIIADAGGVGIGVTGGSGGSIAGAVGISMAINQITNTAGAAVDTSTVTASEPITVSGTTDQAKISALTIAASAGLAGSAGFAASLSGAGAGSGNTINNVVTATITDSTVTSTFAGTIEIPDGIAVLASDTSEIIATSVGASLAAALSGTTGVSVAVGIAVSNNEIGNKTTASIVGSTIDSASGISVGSDQVATITATSVAASLAVAGGSVGVGVTGAGASANNTISNQTIALVDESVLTASGDVSVDAIDTSTIDATIVAASVSVAGGATGVAAAFGFSSAANRFGNATTFLDDPTADRADGSALVKALVHGSQIDTDGTLSVNAKATGTIDAEIIAASVAAAAGSTGASVAGTGVSSTNDMEVEIIAVIQDSIGTGIDAGLDVIGGAVNDSTVRTLALAASVAVAAGVYSGGISVAASVAEAKIKNKVQSQLRRSNVSSGGRVSFFAGDTTDATVTAQAASVAIAVGMVSVAIAGGGASADGENTSIVDSRIQDSTLDVAGSVNVQSNQLSTSDVQTEVATEAAGVIGIGVSGSSATSIITPNTTAKLIGSDVTSLGVGLLVFNNPVATADAAGLTISTGGAVGVSVARVELGGTVEAIVDSAGKRIETVGEVSALLFSSSPTPSRAFAQGSAGGALLGVDATVTSAADTTKAKAEIANGSVIVSGGDVIVEVSHGFDLYADSSSLAAGLIAAGVTKSAAETDAEIIGRIGSGVDLQARDLTARVFSRPKNFANTVAGAVGGISGAVAIPSTRVITNAAVEIGEDSNIDLSGDASLFVQHDGAFDTTLLAASGGYLSGGGGDLDNVISPTTRIDIGDRTTINSSWLAVKAESILDKNSSSSALGNVDATAGGLIAGVGVDSVTDLTIRTTIDVGADARIAADNLSVSDARFEASNRIDAIDELTLRSGGVAAGGSNNSTIRTLADETKITFGPRAQLTTTGALNVYTGGGGDIDIQANSETFGAATIGSGVSTIDIRPKNYIILADSASIETGRDLNLSAGTDTNFNRDEYNIDSRVDTFAGSLIPIDVMDARANLIQDNRITVSAGAAVRSAGDLRMHTDRFGDNNVLAQVKAINWTTGVTGAIDGLVGAGGVEQFAGTAVSEATGVVTVDGTAQTGISRNRVLEITSIERTAPPNNPNGTPGEETPDLYTVNLSDRSTGDVAFQKRVAPVNSALDLALAQAEQQLDLYSDNATLRNFYQAEVTRLTAELEAQNLLETPEGADPSVRQRIVRIGLTIDVNPIFAKAGSIDVRADNFSRNGILDAPGDASVEIINQSRASIELQGIEIPEDNGGVFFNGNQIIGGLDASGEPSILVDNTYVVPSGNNAITWPNITVAGAVTNLGGDITLQTVKSGAGSITINAPISGKTQTISAGNSGAVVINLPNTGSIYEAGGAEHAKWNELTSYTYLGIPVGGKGTNSADPLPPSHPFDFTREPNPAVTNYLNSTPTNISLTGSSIYVSAQYINVNGIIQSGKPEYQLVLGQTIANKIASLKSGDSTGVVNLGKIGDGDFLVQYDLDRDRIVVEELRVSGGYVDLTGHVTNTHNGEIRVLSDYAKINIDNQTPYDIEVKRLDVSRRGQGTVIIKDLSDATADDPRVSIYQREDDVIRVETPDTSEFVPNGTDFVYQPKNGLRYGWTIAEEELERTTTVTGTSSWLGLDFIAPDPDDVVSTKTQRIGTPTITDAGPFFYTSTANTKRYEYSSREYQINSRNRTCCNRTETNWIGTKTYYQTYISERGTRTLHTHTIEADRPIDIRFEGYTEGEIQIESDGNVFIAGALVNPNGMTTIHSDKSVLQGSIDGVVGGVNVRINAEGAIGSDDVPLLTNVVNIIPFDYQSDRLMRVGDPTLAITFVDPGILVKVSEGHTEGGEIGAIYRYEGPSGTVALTRQDFADTQRWTKLTEFADISSVGLQTVDGNISIREVSGDLPIERVWANRDGSNHADGDVSLTAQGSIVQGRSSADQFHLGYVDGNSINLVSETGSIGELAGENGDEDRALPVDAGFFNAIKNPNHRLSASAANDIYMHHFTSMILDSVIAGGDVRIDFVEGGTLIDGNANDLRDERAVEEVAATVWDDLQLTEDRGAGDKRDERIEALVASQSQSYNAYWNFRETQSDPTVYDASHRVTLSDQERDFYGDDAAINALEDSRTAQYHDLHAKWGPLGDSRIDDYIYEPTTADLEAIDASMKVWTEEELLSLRSVEFLNVTDTEFVIEEPNIVARNVTLNVSEGIGRYQNGTTIDLRSADQTPVVLTLDEQASITAAEPGDIVYLQQAPSLVLARIQTSTIELVQQNGEDTVWSDLGFAIGQFIYLESNTRDTTDDGAFLEITALDGVQMTLDVSGLELGELQVDQPRNILIAPAVTDPADHDTAPFIRVLRREDIDIETRGDVNATSTRHIFIGSESDLQLGRIQAGTDQRVQIKIEGDLTAASSGEANIVGGRIVLESGGGSIGSIAIPVGIEAGAAGYLIARAQNDVVISQHNATGNAADLRINQVFSETALVQLEADQSIIDAFRTGNTNIQAVDIVLRAGATIGSAIDFLDINVGENGSVTATADGGIWLSETVGNLNLRQVLSQNGNVNLRADASILDAIDVADPYDPRSGDAAVIAGNPRADVIGNSIKLAALRGTIGSPGNEVDIDSNNRPANGQSSNVRTSSTQSTYLIETRGDLRIAAVETDERTAFLAAPSGVIHVGIDDNTTARAIDIRGGDNILRFDLSNLPTDATTVRVIHDRADQVQYGDGWTVASPRLSEGEFVHVLRQGAVEIEVENDAPYANPLQRFDINQSRNVTVADALTLINALSRAGGANGITLIDPTSPEDLIGFRYLDPSQDGRVTAIDALIIINALSRGAIEGEMFRSSSLAPTKRDERPERSDEPQEPIEVLHGFPDLPASSSSRGNHDAWFEYSRDDANAALDSDTKDEREKLLTVLATDTLRNQ